LERRATAYLERIVLATALLALVNVRIGIAEGPDRIVFPDDAPVMRVADYDIDLRDNDHDDTPGMQKMMSKHIGLWPKPIMYLPAGVYNLRKTLHPVKPNGWEERGLMIMGEDRDKTIIKLADNCPGYQDPGKPRPMLRMGSVGGKNVIPHYS
jgi:hypothetical protein